MRLVFLQLAKITENHQVDGECPEPNPEPNKDSRSRKLSLMAKNEFDNFDGTTRELITVPRT